MAIRLLILVFLVSFGCYSQHDNSNYEFEKFKDGFPIQLVPYNTISLNKYDTYLRSISEKKSLSLDDCAKYFFSGSKSKLIYEYENFNMETGESKGIKKDNFSFYPVFRIEQNKLLFLGFLREGPNSYEYFLAVFTSDNNEAKDVLEINKVNQELLPELFQFSVIDSNLEVKIFRYEQNPRYWQELKSKKKEEVNKSFLTSRSYKIDLGTLKFIQVKKEASYSKCAVSDFLHRNPDCINDDPFKSHTN